MTLMVGKRVAKFRKERGWTQSELAKVIGLSRGYIAAIEEGKRPGLKTAVMIAQALGVEAKDLYEEQEGER